MLRKVIIANALLVLIYLFFNWIEYAFLSTFSPNAATLQSHFPLYVAISAAVNGEPSLALVFNFPLLIFLVAIIVNVRFIYRMQEGR